METVYFLGIDVSKKKLDSALTIDGKNYQQDEMENTADAIRVFFKKMKKMFGMKSAQMIVCMEHTGVYCLPLLDFLTKNKIKTCLESAVQRSLRALHEGKVIELMPIVSRNMPIKTVKNCIFGPLKETLCNSLKHYW